MGLYHTSESNLIGTTRNLAHGVQLGLLMTNASHRQTLSKLCGTGASQMVESTAHFEVVCKMCASFPPKR